MTDRNGVELREGDRVLWLSARKLATIAVIGGVPFHYDSVLIFGPGWCSSKRVPSAGVELPVMAAVVRRQECERSKRY